MATSKSSKASTTGVAADPAEQTPEAEKRETLAIDEAVDEEAAAEQPAGDTVRADMAAGEAVLTPDTTRTPATEGDDGEDTAAAEQAVEQGNAQVQAQVDREEERGLRGVEVDPTPNEHYTVAGVTQGLPTPETDADAHDAAYQAASPRNPHRTQ